MRPTLLQSLLSAFCLAASLAQSAKAADELITIADIGSGSATHWPSYIADAKGFFKAQGVAIEYIPTQSSASVMQQISAGSVNMGGSGLVDAIRAIDKGADVAIVRIESGPAPYELFAKSSIKSFADLKGKTIMIGGIKDITRIYVERMLTPNGVKPGDYDLVFAGATSARFAALASGSIDATIIASPFNFKARSAGYTNFGSSVKYATDFPFAGFSVSRTWAKKNKAQIDKFLAGYSAGVDWFYNPANKKEAVDILLKVAPTTNREDAEQTFDFFTELRVYDRIGAVATSGIDNLIKIMKDQGELEGSTDVARFYDAAFAAK